MYMKNSKKHYQNYPSEHMHIDKKTTQVSYFNLMCGDFFFFQNWANDFLMGPSYSYTDT